MFSIKVDAMTKKKLFEIAFIMEIWRIAFAKDFHKNDNIQSEGNKLIFYVEVEMSYWPH